SNLGWILIMIGLFLQLTQLAWLGILVFSGGALFALVTLPVEFDASARARRMLADSGIIQTDAEMRGVSNVLNAAALTYVAGLVTAVLQLLYYVSLVSGRSRD
ncbi:MAG TPA: zinc metallopeptidase, partial [Anaerolineales bacterium]|nr:zinc metallopeptidase [Anaerolineales bacterium]